MSNEISLKFGSLTFGSVTTITRIKMSLSKCPKLYDIPKMDGSVAEVARKKSINISVEGDVYGTDYDDKRTNLDTLKAAFNAGLQKFTKDDDRYIMAQLDSLDDDDVLLRHLSSWRAAFIAHYPFWLSETLHEDSAVRTSGASITLNNAGNAPTRVKILITAPGGGISDNIQIANSTRGELLKYRGTVVAADVLEIDNRVDTDDFEVLNDGIDDHPNFEGDFLNLDPGNNTIVFTGTAGTTVAFYWHDAWH